MSMLAERRRKTKWVINPTKKPIWTTDSEGIKLGKQLMEKMGWSAGKGLGAKEQGIQEPLKVSYKNDTKGMGFKGNDEDWMEHQDEFNSLLSQLSNSDSNKPAEIDKSEIKSLEEKSKHSRARVHYQKFTRGKDLSRYSETDLACILGINHKKPKNSVEEKNPVEVKTDGNYETSFGVTTKNSGSILDYFKKKWTIGKPKENNSSEVSEEVTEDTLNNTEECKPTLEHKKSKKRKLDELDGENQQVPEDGIMKTEEAENSEVGEEIKKNKKSKKQKLNEVDGDNLEVFENETVEASEEAGKESKKHKKSKKKNKEDINIESESVSSAHKKEKYDADNSYQIEEHKDIQVTADVKNVSNNNNLSLDDENYESCQLLKENSKDSDKNFSRKGKKDKKKHKTKELDTQDENLETVQEGFDHKIKKKKKKEKDHITEGESKEVSGEHYRDIDKHNSLTENGESKSVSNGDEEIQKLDLVEDAAIKDAEENKSRKEKRRKEKQKSDPSKLENEEEVTTKSQIPAEEVESKSKNKKRKEKLSDQSIAENDEEQEIKAKSIIEEVGPTVKEKKKKGKHKTDLSKLENEKEQETESKTTSEETEECKIKEKKKKDKHRSDQSTLENEEKQVTKSAPEEIEPEAKEKISKKDKSSKTKKSKHKTDSEGIDESNTNSESVEETNAIEKQSKKLKKAEIDTKAKQDESKTGNSNRIHSHKVQLFKKKKFSLMGGLSNTPNNRVMGLIFGAEFDKFKGANLENLAGYGMQKEIKGKGDG